MWVCLNDAFLSIVADRNNPKQVLVRSRKKEHLESFLKLPHWAKKKPEIIETLDADYAYRAFITRTLLAGLLADQVNKIDYPKFKPSVKEKPLHDLYMDFWKLHYKYQTTLYGPGVFG
jgi:hypothetical protein